mmetsp:Transcript_20814/g.38732  ORF Transcript_20814/g.38732 Transcript_20814/m.38732 type:complete len:439 (+) Transcript_20814:403-1719(+)
MSGVSTIEEQAFGFYLSTEFLSDVKFAAKTLGIVGNINLFLNVAISFLLIARLVEIYRARKGKRADHGSSSNTALYYTALMLLSSLTLLYRGIHKSGPKLSAPIQWFPDRIEVIEITPGFEFHPSVFCEPVNETESAFCSSFLIGKPEEDFSRCVELNLSGFATYWLTTTIVFYILAVRARVVGTGLGVPKTLRIIRRITEFLLLIFPISVVVFMIFFLDIIVLPGGLCVQSYDVLGMIMLASLQFALSMSFLLLFLYPLTKAGKVSGNQTHIRRVARRNLLLSGVAIVSSLVTMIWTCLIDMVTGADPADTVVNLPSGPVSAEAFNAEIIALEQEWIDQWFRLMFLIVPTTDTLINFFMVALISSAWRPRCLTKYFGSSRTSYNSSTEGPNATNMAASTGPPSKFGSTIEGKSSFSSVLFKNERHSERRDSDVSLSV